MAKAKRRRRRKNPVTWAKGALKGNEVKLETQAKWSKAKTDSMFQNGMITITNRGANFIPAGDGLGKTERAALKLAARRRASKKKTTKKRATKKRATKKRTTKKRATKKRATKKKSRSAVAKKKKKRKKRASKRALVTRGWVRDTKRRKTGSRRKSTTVRLRAGYRLPTKKRKALVKGGYLSKAGRVNPGRKKRKKRRKTGAKRRRTKTKRRAARRGKKRATRKRRRRRRNPYNGMLGSVTNWTKRIAKVGLAAGAAYMIHGYSSYIVDKIANMIPANAPMLRKGLRVLGAGATTVASIYLAKKLEGVGARKFTGNWISTSALVLGSLYTLATAIQEFLPTSAIGNMLPSFTRPSLPGIAGMGDWVELRGMGDYDGMGDFQSPEQLVAGESFARSVNQFDGMGDFRIDSSNIRGIGMLPSGQSYPGQYGMGDWLESIHAPAGAAFAPGPEGF